MSDPNNKNHSRRNFLSLGLLSTAGLIKGEAPSQPAIEIGENMKMLTQDGKLVEIDKALITRSSSKKPATKKDVLEWIHNPK